MEHYRGDALKEDVSVNEEQTASLKTALLHRARDALGGADPDANRSAGFKSNHVVTALSCATQG